MCVCVCCLDNIHGWGGGRVVICHLQNESQNQQGQKYVLLLLTHAAASSSSSSSSLRLLRAARKVGRWSNCSSEIRFSSFNIDRNHDVSQWISLLQGTYYSIILNYLCVSPSVTSPIVYLDFLRDMATLTLNVPPPHQSLILNLQWEATTMTMLLLTILLMRWYSITCVEADNLIHLLLFSLFKYLKSEYGNGPSARF